MAHQRDVHFPKVFFSPDSRFLVSVNEPDPCRLWDPATGSFLGEFGTQVHDAAFSRDGQLLLAIDDGQLTLWKSSTGETLRRFEIPAPYRAEVCAFSNDGKACGAGGGGYTMGTGWYGAWDLVTSDQLCLGELVGDQDDVIGVVSIGTATDGRFAAWSKGQCNLPSSAFIHELQTGQCIAQGKFDGRSRLFPPTFLLAIQVENGFQLTSLGNSESWEINTDAVNLPVGSARGSWLAWVDGVQNIEESTGRGSLVIYDMEHHQIRHRLALNPAHASLHFSREHDDLLAATTNLVHWDMSPEYTIFWNVSVGTPLAWAKGHQMFSHCSFSPDRCWFASITSVYSSKCDNERIAPGSVLLTDLRGSLPIQGKS